jgi:hypothetical protein
MQVRKIFVLGGYGGTGRRISEWLLRETDAQVIVGGRNLEKAEELRDRLNRQYPGQRAAAAFADASDAASLQAAFGGASLVIDASIAVAHARTVALAALDSNCDYLDFHFEQSVLPALELLAPRVKAAGRCFITQAGFHPGLPAAFIRYAAPEFERYDSAIIGMAMSQKVEKPESLYELVDILNDYKVDVFKGGAWKPAGSGDFRTIDFGPRFGARTCYPLQMAEIRAMPDMFGLRETGVYVAGFNWFVDYVVFPLAILLFKIKKGLGRELIAKLLWWGINRPSRSRGVSFVLDAAGKKGGVPVTLRLIAEHDDAYEFTAIPVVACVRQFLDGVIAPGLWMMGHAVEPDRLFEDMARMGIPIRRQAQ